MEDVATQEGAIQSRIESILAREEAPEAPAQEATEEDTSEVETELEADEAESEGSQEEPEETEEADASEEDQEPQLELSDLATYLGVEEDRLDVDDDGNLYVKTKVDGQEGRAKFDDLIKSYQLEGHLNKQNMEVQSLRKELEQKQAELEQQSSQRLQQLEDLANVAWQELTADFNNVNWQDLRQEDPVEFAAKSEEFRRREQRIQQLFQQAQSQRQQQSQADQGRMQETLQKEGEKLMQAIPEWRDESVASKEKKQIRDFALSVGFQPQEVDSLSDHRAVVILRDAMKYRELQCSKPEVSKKVRKAPKLSKPGRKPSKGEQDQTKLNKLRGSIRKSGGKQGVAEYLLASGKVD